MKNLEIEFYNIKDLRIVMINKNYIEYKENDYVNYFNENVKFIVEKTVIEDKDKNGLPYYAEYYTECLTEEDLSVRNSHNPFTDVPKMFSIVSRIPGKFFTKEEINNGKISAIRIFQILQDINVEKNNLENNKEKKLVLKKE